MDMNEREPIATSAAFAAAFFASLGSRERDVLRGRFGLDGNEPMTLQAIGDRYGITRERVRQIEAGALLELRRSASEHPYVRRITDAAVKELRSQGGVTREDSLLANLKQVLADRSADVMFGNVVRFVLEFSKKFSFYRDSGADWHSYWYLSKEDRRKAEAFVSNVIAKAKAEKNKILSGNFPATLATQAKAAKLPAAVAENFVSLSKSFVRGPFGEAGLAEWAEVNPKTARDWAYAVLKREGKPLHFSDLSRIIGSHRKDKRTNLQTIHNELIKDDRFVLVGRGLYGLREHGYIAGTAREIICHFLSKNGPLHPSEVVRLVREQRMLKDATILINLQSRKHFTCLEDGRYSVREA